MKTVAILAVAIVGMWTFGYYTATPEFFTPCAGAWGPEVEWLEAAGETEVVMPFEPNARYGIGLCLQAFDGRNDDGPVPADVVFDRVYLDSP